MDRVRRRTRLSALLPLGLLLLAGVYAQPYRPMVVSGVSMAPTYQPNEPLWVSTNVDSIRRDDVVLVKRGKEVFVKRVRLIEGDEYGVFKPFGTEWKIPGNRLQVAIAKKNGMDFRYRRIPAGSVFVTGDNYLESTDSREWGPVEVQDIIGKVIDNRGPEKGQFQFPITRFAPRDAADMNPEFDEETLTAARQSSPPLGV